MRSKTQDAIQAIYESANIETYSVEVTNDLLALMIELLDEMIEKR